ncbi:abortive infection family protein [Thermohalobaculum sediminis]|uniref:abortive infection family protein n=1 Tax=Thermohalobaculum sediminis TaxID=2939436 RepID=UPI003872A7D7
MRQILAGLTTAVSGIGSLRTHSGDAHGRERGTRRIDKRVAELAINSASSISLFLIATWEKRFPGKDLWRHGE